MPHRRLWIIFWVASSLFVWPDALSADALAERRLEEQLEILLPGTDLQRQSARAYAQQQLQLVFTQLEANRVRRKSERRALQMIEQAIEDEFLQAYERFADFADLFKAGAYDQATATAIYALALEYFGLSYQIRTEPGSVYVLADPENEAHPLVVREWRQGEDRAFREQYIRLLREVGGLAEAHRQLPDATLFERYYFSNTEVLTLRQLASYLCYQQAMRAYQLSAYTESLHWLEQAQDLSAQPLYGVLERAVWLQLARRAPTGREGLYYLWKIWEGDPGDPWETELLRRFHEAANEQLVGTGDAGSIDSIYQYFNDHFTGHAGAQLRLREMYYVKQARYFASQNQVAPVMSYMDSLYHLQPDDPEVQDVIAGMLVWSLRAERDFTKGLQAINHYRQRYPFLTSHDYFQDQDLFYRAEQIRYYFDQDESVRGMSFLQEFESLLYRYGDTPRRVSWISTAYLSAAAYYQRMDDDWRALELVQKAN
ncbi:MAG: hypothetical protein KDC54_08540, partial [Lewinella sp.]|nr:hypothetical protein [Lewinella sp.]